MQIEERHLEWCRDALFYLVRNNYDGCRELNGVGFNRVDSPMGHALAGELESVGNLSDKQWRVAFKMVPKYRNQPGFPPVPEDLDQILASKWTFA